MTDLEARILNAGHHGHPTIAELEAMADIEDYVNASGGRPRAEPDENGAPRTEAA